MRVVVFGGRDFHKQDLAFRALDQIDAQYGIDLVIDGKANGADKIGNLWAVIRGKETERYPADWAKFGRAAGVIRNRQMIEEGNPEMGIAFPGGRGTENMKKQLKEHGIKVLNVVIKGE
jgi:hypothetical protein